MYQVLIATRVVGQSRRLAYKISTVKPIQEASIIQFVNYTYVLRGTAIYTIDRARFVFITSLRVLPRYCMLFYKYFIFDIDFFVCLWTIVGLMTTLSKNFFRNCSQQYDLTKQQKVPVVPLIKQFTFKIKKTQTSAMPAQKKETYPRVRVTYKGKLCSFSNFNNITILCFFFLFCITCQRMNQSKCTYHACNR